MKVHTHILSALITLLVIPVATIAQSAPSAVTGINASYDGTKVTVSWDAVTSDPISYYRVYYSGESILDNDGLYDDFETTEGDETTLSFIPPRGMQSLFVSVIAAATSGLESEFFTDEALVSLVEESDPPPPGAPPAKPKGSTSPVPDVPKKNDASVVRLLKATADSPEQISVEFSSSLTVDAKGAPKGLKIEDPNGEKLQITSITIDAKTVTIKTKTQQKGTVYKVQFSEPFEGKSGQPLDATDRSVLVTGHPDGKDAPPPPPPMREVDPMSPPDVANVSMNPQLQDNGAYSITLEWVVDNEPGDLYGIVAYQTRDGQTFGPPSLLPIDIRGVTLNDVTPGFFGIYLQTVNTYGYVSEGVFQYVTLPYYIPGYGFYGSLTYGSTAEEDTPDLAEEEEEEVPEGMVAMEPITEETPMQELEGVDHSAAFEASQIIDWKGAAILAGSVAGVVILIVGSFVVLARPKGV